MWKVYDHDNCKGCKYFGGHSEGAKCCNYIFDVGMKRPCPPGDECTVKVPIKRDPWREGLKKYKKGADGKWVKK